MNSRFLLFVIAVLAFAFVIGGCSKSDSSTGPEGTAPTFPSLLFKAPTTNSSDQNVQLIKSYVATFNSFATYFAPFQALKPTQSGNNWVWNYALGTLTAVVTATPQSDGSFLWKLVLNGVDPSDGTAYNNWTALEGTTSSDGKNGTFKVYEDNKTILDIEFVWTTVNNVLTGTLKGYSSGTFTGQDVIVNNPDNSGSMMLYTGTVNTYKATWIANGSGQWWTYNSSGAQTGTGTWS